MRTPSAGKQQLDYKYYPKVAVWVTSSDARQLRSSFFGSEALREQMVDWNVAPWFVCQSLRER